MKDMRRRVGKGLRCMGLVAGMRVSMMGQTFQSTTTVSANSPSLVLPGSLTLTSVVNNTPTPGGVPTGSITFSSDGNNSLGTAPLKMIPSSQSFPGAPTVSINTSGTGPAGLVAVDILRTGKPALVYGNNTSGASSVTVLPNLGAGQFGGTGTLTSPLGNYNGIDAIVSGFFLNKTQKTALVHAPYAYNVLNVNASGLGLIYSQAGPLYSSTESEKIVVEDFDGDGFSDVGVLVLGNQYYTAQVGFALNKGASSPGSFNQFIPIALPTTKPDGTPGNFCPDAIAAGSFDSTAKPELAVLGHFGVASENSRCNVAAPAGTPSYVALFAFPTATPTFTPAGNTGFDGSLIVTIADTASDATIHYTTDGTTPTNSSTVYSGPITITTATTLNAVAISPQYGPSAVVTATYEPFTAAPTLSPGPGGVNEGTQVTITDATTGAVIYYTYQGFIDQLYTGPVTISKPGILSAYAIAPNHFTSMVVSGLYTINVVIGFQPAPPGENQGDATPLPPSGAAASHTVLEPRSVSIVPVLIAVGTDQTTIASSDLNQDGKADLVIGSSTTGEIQLYYGNGDGTFTAGAVSSTPGSLLSLDLDDFNADGFPDLAATLNGQGVAVLLNDGKGKLQAATRPYTTGTTLSIASADLNADGLADLALLEPLQANSKQGSISILLSSESAQASLVTPARSLPAGTHSITASFPGDTNFRPSTSTALAESVTKGVPSITWPTPAPIVYGTALSATQLDASASTPGAFVYTPALNTVLSPGSQTLSAAFTPADTFDYAVASGKVTLQVNLPTISLKSVTPSSASLGAQSVSITVSGAGFSSDAVVQWNGANLTTTYVNPDSLTAVIPASDLTTAGQAKVTVYDATRQEASGSSPFTVTAPQPVTNVSVPPTANPDDQPSIAVTLNPYPADVTVTITLSFADDSTNPAPSNGSIKFENVPSGDQVSASTNGQPVDTFTITQNTTAAITPRVISAGNVAGVITVTTTMKAGGQDVTPSSLSASRITVSTAVPTIQSAVYSTSGDTLQVVILGYSPTREISAAQFHFTPATGRTLATSDVNLSSISQFPSWFSSSDSDNYGSAFKYTQTFNLSSDASVISGVTVTLHNGQGSSTTATAQPQ